MRPDRKPGLFGMLWGLFYPYLLYQGIATIVSIAAASLLMTLNSDALASVSSYNELIYALSDMITEHYAGISAAAALFTLPVLIVLFRGDTAKERAAKMHVEWEGVPFYHYLIVTVMGAAACLALNNLLEYSHVTELLKDTYEPTANLLFRGSVLPEILLMGILIPVVEELIFRGIAYRRMRWYLGPVPAMILSAVYFGAVHGNWLQGIYAFIIGMLLAFCYERFHCLLAPILVHAAANIIAVLISDGGFLSFVYQNDNEIAFLIVTAAAMVVFVITFYLMVTYVYPRKKTDAALTGPDRSNGI